MAAYQEKTFTELLAALLADARTRLQRITNWRVGGVMHSILGVMAKGLEQLYQVVTSAISLAFYDTSTGTYLNRIANLHSRPRLAAGKTRGRVIYGRAAAGPAVTIPAGAYVATVVLDDGQNRLYRVLTATVLPAPDLEVEVDVEALAAGPAYNVGSGAITVMTTHISGLDYVRNDQPDGWIDVEGRDAESDDELRARLPLVWSELSFPAPHEKYRSLALANAGVGACRVNANAPRGDGSVDVVLWGISGPPTPTTIAEVQAAVDLVKPDDADVLVKTASAVAQDVAMTVVKDAAGGEVEAIQAAVETALAALFLPALNERAYQIGDPFTRARLIGEALRVTWVANVIVGTPAADVPLDPDELAQPGTITVNVMGA